MTTFLVMWEIDIDAEDPTTAATVARRIQLDPESLATCFTVIGPDDEVTSVDFNRTPTKEGA